MRKIQFALVALLTAAMMPLAAAPPPKAPAPKTLAPEINYRDERSEHPAA